MKRCISGQASNGSKSTMPPRCSACSTMRNIPTTPRSAASVQMATRTQGLSTADFTGAELAPARIEEVIDRPEDDRDIPSPGIAFDKADEEALPVQQFEAGQEDGERLVLHR